MAFVVSGRRYMRGYGRRFIFVRCADEELCHSDGLRFCFPIKEERLKGPGPRHFPCLTTLWCSSFSKSTQQTKKRDHRSPFLSFWCATHSLTPFKLGSGFLFWSWPWCVYTNAGSLPSHTHAEVCETFCGIGLKRGKKKSHVWVCWQAPLS